MLWQVIGCKAAGQTAKLGVCWICGLFLEVNLKIYVFLHQFTCFFNNTILVKELLIFQNPAHRGKGKEKNNHVDPAPIQMAA